MYSRRSGHHNTGEKMAYAMSVDELTGASMSDHRDCLSSDCLTIGSFVRYRRTHRNASSWPKPAFLLLTLRGGPKGPPKNLRILKLCGPEKLSTPRSTRERRGKSTLGLTRKRPNDLTSEGNTLVIYECRGKKIWVDKDTMVIPSHSLSTATKGTTIVNGGVSKRGGLAISLEASN
ncbi:Holliday junction ATP-dependent DNA helicaseRuvA, partial [Striga asiatica]